MACYVALTGLQSHWKEPSNTLFLTEACRTRHVSEKWREYPEPIDQGHFQNPGELMEAARLCDTLSSHALPLLAELLERHYNLGFPLRFYERLLMPWLLQFTQVLYDRYLSIEKAYALDQNFCFLTVPQAFAYPCTDTHDTVATLQNNDLYNLHLYSEIITFLGYRQAAQPGLPLDAPVFPLFSLPAPPRYNWKHRIRHAASLLTRSVQHAMGKKTHCLASCYGCDEGDAQIAGRGWWMPEPYTWAGERVKPDMRMRYTPLSMQGGRFASLLNMMLPRHLPLGYAEALPGIVDWARRQTVSHIGVLATAQQHYSPFFPVLSHCCQLPLAVLEHGAGALLSYWTGRQINLAVADRFFSWGDTPYSLPSPYLQEKAAPRLLTAPLLVANEVHRFRPRLISDFSRVGSVYHCQRKIFLRELTEYSYPVLRLYFREFGWGVRKDLENEFPTLQFQDANACNIQQAIANTCLVILDHDSTTLHHCLARNIPTLLFSSTDHISLAAKPLLELLQRAHIWHSTPESAAAFYKTLFPQPLGNWVDAAEVINEWWASAEVQLARQTFCERYARTSPEWRKEWRDAFDLLAADGPRTVALCE